MMCFTWLKISKTSLSPDKKARPEKSQLLFQRHVIFEVLNPSAIFFAMLLQP